MFLPEQEILSGFLIHLPEVSGWQLEPAVPLAAPTGGGAEARKAARIWNKYGGLLERLAAKIDIDPGVAVAVAAVESGGEGFRNGRMIIRFENHKFWEHWGENNADKFNAVFRFNQGKK